jgi:ribonuclease HIII
MKKLKYHEGIKKKDTTNQYEVFRAGLDEETLVVYNSGKIVTNGPKSHELIRKMVMEIGEDYEVDIIIGSDETGKGEWLGPMIIAAVAVTPAQSSYLRAEGIMDSKNISIKRISDFAEEVTSRCEAVRIVEIHPRRFNELFKRFKSEKKTMNDLLAWGHATAIKSVYGRVAGKRKEKSIRVIIDEFSEKETKNRIQRVINLHNIQLEQIPRAEKHIAVAAASIVARNAREKWIEEESNRLGIKLRKIPTSEAHNLPNPSNLVKMSFIK